MADSITVNFLPANDVALNLFPLSIRTSETALTVRYATITVVARNEVLVACDPIALSFFGTKDPIPKRFCESLDSRAVIIAQMQHRVLLSEFPIEAKHWGKFISQRGVNINDQSRDMETEAGWANVMGDRLIKYFSSDGWNSKGDMTKNDYRHQYQDPTGYTPVNHALLKPENLKSPLRWQPLKYHLDLHGEYAHQVHVVPHIGLTAKPLTMSRGQVENTTVPSQYVETNREDTISEEDTERLEGYIDELLRRSENVTTETVLLAHFWESKLLSLGTFISRFKNELGMSEYEYFRVLFGEMLALYDSTLVAWKEKRRHDHMRPPALIKRLRKGTMVRAYKGYGKGVGLVKAEEWRPVLPIQPHSEFPSASSALCTASLEQLQIAADDLILKGREQPTYEIIIHPGYLPFSPLQKDFLIRFKNIEEAAKSCGDSRLNAGVHFSTAVSAGSQLGTGIGRIAYEHAKDLYEGRVPEICERCIR